MKLVIWNNQILYRSPNPVKKRSEHIVFPLYHVSNLTEIGIKSIFEIWCRGKIISSCLIGWEKKHFQLCPFKSHFLQLTDKEEVLNELEDKKEEKLEEAKQHLENSKGGETPPPESQFAKLAPSDNKYTILNREEL